MNLWGMTGQGMLLWRYGVAIAAASAAVLLRVALIPITGPGIEYSILFPSVMLVALLLGRGPALAATLAGIYESIPWLKVPARTAAYGLLMLVIESLVISEIGSRLRRSQRQAEERAKAALDAEQALRAANERLLEADRRKNEFLGMLSHELRNPLTPIVTSLHLLERKGRSEEQTQRAQAVIQRQVAHMARLIDDLLDVTRISRGKIVLKRTRLDLTEVLQKVLEDHRSVFADRGIQVTSSLEPNLWVDGDPIRLAQVVSNLLQNSAKFAHRGDRVDVACLADAGHTVVRVRDTGVGIPAELLPRLFQPFAQARQTLDRSGGGLGLGLALVKGLVELHGGTVSASSPGPGQGAEFIFRLPLVSATPALAESGPPQTRSLPHRRVLVIDDNVDVADSLKAVLETLGQKVEVAYSGPEGLDLARDFHPDLVLCDIGLPGMSGFEVAQALRADPQLRSTRLVAVTGYAQKEDQTKAAAAGFDDHLAKPPDISKIEQLLAS